MNTTPLPRPRPRPRPGNEATELDQPAIPLWGRLLLNLMDWVLDRCDDIGDACTGGWFGAATWIKTVVIGISVLAFLMAAVWLGTAVIDAFHALPWPVPALGDRTGLVATIDQPVHHYLAQRTAALPVDATTVYSTWQAVGAVALVLGFLRFTSARILWCLHGAATVWMVAAGTPEPGRQVATGIAVLAWATLSVLALRGIRLRPVIHVDVHNQAPPAPEVRAEIHLPPADKPAPTGYADHHPQPPSLN